MPKLLTPKQRSTIGQVAKSAWRKHHNSGATEEPEAEWRQREAIAACGHRISAAPRSAFDPLMAHFESLGGETGRAFDRLTGPTNNERQLRWKIAQAAKALGLSPDYAANKRPHQLIGILINLERQVAALEAQDA